jgi:hypothetical protein
VKQALLVNKERLELLVKLVLQVNKERQELLALQACKE